MCNLQKLFWKGYTVLPPPVFITSNCSGGWEHLVVSGQIHLISCLHECDGNLWQLEWNPCIYSLLANMGLSVRSFFLVASQIYPFLLIMYNINFFLIILIISWSSSAVYGSCAGPWRVFQTGSWCSRPFYSTCGCCGFSCCLEMSPSLLALSDSVQILDCSINLWVPN